MLKRNVGIYRLVGVLALWALGTVLSACGEEQDKRPLVLVTVAKDGLPAGTINVSIGIKSGDGSVNVTKYFKPEEVNSDKGVGVYLATTVPANTPVSVVMTALGADGQPLATATQTATVSPGATVKVAFGKVPGVDAGSLDADPGQPDALALGDATSSVDVGAVLADTRGVDSLATDVTLDTLSADTVVSDTGLDRVPTSDAGVDVPATLDAQPDVSTLVADAAGGAEVGAGAGWIAGENIEKDILNRTYLPVVVVDPVNDHVYSAWAESANVRVRRWNNTTQAWDATKTVESRGQCSDVKIGADAKGGITVSWVQDPYASDTAMPGVWSSRTTDGVAWTPPARIAAGMVWETAMAVARNGMVRLVYTKQTAANTHGLFAAFFDGTAWAEHASPIETPALYQSEVNPRLVVSAAGEGYVLYDKPDPDGEYSVAASVLSGKTSSAPVILDAAKTSAVYYRDVAVNTKGDVVAVWSEYTGSSKTTMNLYGRSYSANGWSATSPVIASAGELYDIAAVLDDNGIATVTWQQGMSTGDNLVATRGSLTGAWSTPELLETDNLGGNLTTDFPHAQMGLDKAGNVYVAWRKKVKSDPLTFGIYGRRFAGGAWEPAAQLGQRAGFNSGYPSLSVSDSGRAAVGFYYYIAAATSDAEAYNAYVAMYR